MNFFKSILADDSDPVNMNTHKKSNEISTEEQQTNSNLTSSGDNDVSNDVSAVFWSFGDLVKNLTAKSESVIETDEEAEEQPNGGSLWSFGDLVKTITTKSGDEEQLTTSNSNSDVSNDVINSGGGLWRFGELVKNLTNNSESVLETYRRDLKEFGSELKKESDLFREVANRAVKELPETMKSISQGKNVDIDDSDVNRVYYSRFDSQLNALQNDVQTYCKDPEDNLDEYSKWKLGFVLSEKESEIEKLIGDNSESGYVEAIYKKIVPNEVDDGSFWCRYFYKVYKLKQEEDVRVSLVTRSLNVDDEEELSWDVDNDDDVEADLREIEKKRNLNDEVRNVNSNVSDDDTEKNSDIAIVNENNVGGLKPSGGNVSDEKVELMPKTDENRDPTENVGKDVCDEKLELVLKTDENLDISKQEDIEWDEIGDIGENDEKNVSQSETPKKGELFKRLSNDVEDDEDLSWDIEDDDEPVKAGSSK